MISANNYKDLTEDEMWELFDKIDLDTEVQQNDISNEEEKEETYLCSSCHSDSLVNDPSKGYYVCNSCGVINQQYLDKHPEYNNYEDGKEEANRCGCPTNYFFPKASLGTKIKANNYSRLKVLHSWGQMPYRERSLLTVLENIQGKCKKYKITQTIIDNAKIMYKKINDCKHMRGKNKGKNIIIRCINRKSLIAACVFFGCKLQGKPRSPKEIADIFDLELKQVNKGCRKFLDLMNIDILMYKIRCSQSTDFIERYCKKLKIKKEYIECATRISNNIHKLDIASTHQPPSVAAGSILLMANLYDLDISKKSISEIFVISDVTIAKTYRKIQPYHKIITSDEITDKIYTKLCKKSGKATFKNDDDFIINTDSDNMNEDNNDNETSDASSEEDDDDDDEESSELNNTSVFEVI
ncbi:Transcription factor TFIIB repeat [seawater metagenome]|uniref:Transcription factor TFIIB repeat n=1 Tax=seawater metagenome TaxID=1561972 RepID=A0A5E8CK12_9ZZZZ